MTKPDERRNGVIALVRVAMNQTIDARLHDPQRHPQSRSPTLSCRY